MIFLLHHLLLKKIKENFGDDVWIASDVCLCSYTSHGHCGILNEDHSQLVNNKTVDVLSKYSTQLANAGADCIAPSDMMDGRIAAIRTSLDALNYDTCKYHELCSKIQFTILWTIPRCLSFCTEYKWFKKP